MQYGSNQLCKHNSKDYSIAINQNEIHPHASIVSATVLNYIYDTVCDANTMLPYLKSSGSKNVHLINFSNLVRRWIELKARVLRHMQRQYLVAISPSLPACAQEI